MAGDRKKVLIITNSSGFLWKFEMENVRILRELGFEVHYASNIYYKAYDFEPDELMKRGVIFHHISIARSPYMYKMNAEALRDTIRLIDRENVSVVHCHTPMGGVIGRIAAFLSKRKPKVIYTAHGFLFYKGAPLINNTLYQAAERILAPLTDVLIVINKEDYAAAKTMRLKKGGKIYYIPGEGADLDYFQPVSGEEKRRARARIGIAPDVYFALSVGELNLNKNHRTAIRAVKKIVDGRLLDRKLIYGICGDGFFRDDLESFVRELHAGEFVRLYGYRGNIRDYYAAADLTVFPSVREGLGMAGIESLAMGVPVVASDNRGTREYMRDGVNGCICTADSVRDFADGIVRLCKMPEDRRARMAADCRKSVAGFSGAVTRDVMEKVYRRFAL